ncbi:hypothetical protein Ancab_034495 [Ancistrocladus abbreviatus]
MPSSSAHKPRHLLALCGGTAAAATPPPSPSTQPNRPTSDAAAAEALSHLLQRLQPTISLPSRFSQRTTTTTTITSPPTISFCDPNFTLLSSAASQHGFFQLAHHAIHPELANSAESDSLSLFSLPPDKKHQYFLKNWPLGYHQNDEDEENCASSGSFCLDSLCSTESSELSLSSLREFTRELEKVGLKLLEVLSCAIGFVNPLKEGPTKVSSLMWVIEESGGSMADETGHMIGRFYPYVVRLQYQIRRQKYSLLTDSGSITVLPDVDSIFVTLGDIAQVWSNGKTKKVRGARPMNMMAAAASEDAENAAPCSCISTSLLVALPLDSTVSPLLPLPLPTINDGNGHEHEHKAPDEKDADRRLAFNSFSFEDYAWRVYHERLLFKDDPLERYRTT